MMKATARAVISLCFLPRAHEVTAGEGMSRWSTLAIPRRFRHGVWISRTFQPLCTPVAALPLAALTAAEVEAEIHAARAERRAARARRG